MAQESNKDVYELSYGAELFIDDMLIALKRDITRVPHAATKVTSPVLAPEPGRPWEYGGFNRTKRVFLLGTVLHDKFLKKYRMWYMTRMDPNHGHRIPALYVPRTGAGNTTKYSGRRIDDDGRYFAGSDTGDLLCYAESDNGLNWRKPDLGVFQFDDSENNNIVWDIHGASVFLNSTTHDPQKRYQAIGFCRRYRNIFLITSADGIHWSDTELKHPVLERANEGPTNVIYDKKRDIYRAYMLVKRGTEPRHIEYSQSKSLQGTWSKMKSILEPTEEDDMFGQVRHNAIRAEFHNMSGFRYGSIYVGILGVLYVTEDITSTAPGQAAVDGPIEAQLVYSRDGENWTLFEDRSPIISRGEKGAFDAGMILFTAKEPLVEDDAIHWYYTGCTTTHGRLLTDKVMSIGRASWRLDGFVSLDAKANVGVVETVPLRIENGQLKVNVDVTEGDLTVEVLSQSGRVQPGFAANDFVPIRGDYLRHPLRWRQKDLNNAQQPFRLRFTLRQGKLFSLRVEP